MKIAVASDHAGFRLKTALAAFLRDQGHEVEDLGTDSDERVDYPDYAAAVARRVTSGQAERGLLVCATGTGMAIAANKVPGARAAAATSDYLARLAREHNDANILCLGERVIGSGAAESIVRQFLAADFLGNRHARRIHKIQELEKKAYKKA